MQETPCMQTAAAPEEENKMSTQPSVRTEGCFFARFRQKRRKMQCRSSPHAEPSAASEDDRAHLRAEISAACALLTNFSNSSRKNRRGAATKRLQKPRSTLQNAAFVNENRSKNVRVLSKSIVHLQARCSKTCRIRPVKSLNSPKTNNEALPYSNCKLAGN